MSDNGAARIERDSMGEMSVPASAYYGATTMRAVLNFPISDLRFPRSFIRAIGLIKAASAQVNQQLGLLDPELARAIIRAGREVAEGKFDDQFVLDIFQTGSGTSTNMNANEVIANRANEILGSPLGSRRPIHPNDHVNICQSSNDVIPTAIHLSALLLLTEELAPALDRLHEVLEEKSSEFWEIIKTGRTHLQDATPIRLGQEFKGYAGQIDRARGRLDHAIDQLREVALGGTAVGTGINAHPEFARRVCELLGDWVGIPIHETENHFQAQNTLDAVAEASGSLRTLAESIFKIANDLRWLASGPRAGLGELAMPEVQPGSSIMPGKVNPVICESAMQVAAQVVGNDTTVTLANLTGSQFELNTMLPVAAYNLLQSISLLATTCRNLAEQAIAGIQATSRGPDLVEQGLMLATALAPHIGYDAAAAIAKEAAKTGRTIREVARERTSLTEEQLTEYLNPALLTQPGAKAAAGGG